MTRADASSTPTSRSEDVVDQCLFGRSKSPQWTVPQRIDCQVVPGLVKCVVTETDVEFLT